MKTYATKDGYLKVELYNQNVRKKEYIHRLVGKALLKKDENKTEINHKDKNRKNNCVYNLEWVSKSENNYHKFSEKN